MATVAVPPPQSAFQSADFSARTKFVNDALTAGDHNANLHDEDISFMPPIMSRPPRDPSVKTDDNDDDATNTDLDYIVSEPNANQPRKVLYTVSRLPAIDPASAAIWQAFHNLRPLSTDYAGDFGTPSISNGCPFSRRASSRPTSIDLRVCPFSQTTPHATRTSLDLIRAVFNWSSLVLPADVTGTFYGVCFRSKRRAGSATVDLYAADKRSHEEAVASGGLLMYWYGIPDARSGNNLATCVWTSRDHARIASRLPQHKRAAGLARDAYASYELSRYRVEKRAGETGVHVLPWGEVEE